jgi:2-polyprenyl-3-methyl-5-hydroxy-6-metoxy-1,4-benzoquinol methylase
MASITDDRGYNQGFKHSKAFLKRTDYRCKTISDNFDKHTGNILEIGCGTGLHAYLIAKMNKKVNVVSTDICESFIESASKTYKLPNLRYEVLDFNDKAGVEKLLKKNGEFDYIFGDGILHHLFYELKNSIHSIKVLLKKGGKLLFWEPNILNPYCFFIFKFKFFRKLANLEPAEMAFSKKHMAKILKEEGFSDIDISHRDFLLPVTPDSLIPCVESVGRVCEKMPLVSRLSQSIFISARK